MRRIVLFQTQKGIGALTKQTIKGSGEGAGEIRRSLVALQERKGLIRRSRGLLLRSGGKGRE
jgi:hypothetical protein